VTSRKPLKSRDSERLDTIVRMLQTRIDSKRVFLPNEMEKLRCGALAGGMHAMRFNTLLRV
jgi:hypothetical protein